MERFTPWKLADTCQSFYSEELLFFISLVQTHELNIHSSGICHGPSWVLPGYSGTVEG